MVTRLTICVTCYLCILTICNFRYFLFWFEGWFLGLDLGSDCFSSLFFHTFYFHLSIDNVCLYYLALQQ